MVWEGEAPAEPRLPALVRRLGRSLALPAYGAGGGAWSWASGLCALMR